VARRDGMPQPTLAHDRQEIVYLVQSLKQAFHFGWRIQRSLTTEHDPPGKRFRDADHRARVVAYRATIALNPTSPITFGKICSAFMRSPHAQTASGASTAPIGISKQ